MDWLRVQPWCGPLWSRDPALLPGAGLLPLALLGSAHRRSADLVVTFAGSPEPDEWGLSGYAPFDAPDVPEGGGMHGGLHPAELATVLIMEGSGFRRGAVVRRPADLTAIAPTILHLLDVPATGMEGEVLSAAFDPTRDAMAPVTQNGSAGRFMLRVQYSPATGRLYPVGMG